MEQTMRRSMICCSVAVIAISVVWLHAQTGSLRFEAASVKRNISNGPSFMTVSGDRFTATNFPVKIFIRNAFRLQPTQLIGGPDWLDDEHYDIVAKSPVRLTGEAVREMQQTLLLERFNLVTHMETRELPIYTLVLARGDGKLGPRMSLTSSRDCLPGRAVPAPSDPQRPKCNWFSSTGSDGVTKFFSGGITMATFAEALSLRLDRKVVDRTGLTGYYDFDLSFTPDFGPPAGDLPPGVVAAPNPDLGSVYTVLQEQLGLKLESARGSVDVRVIDKVDRPTPD
jgi:uncharacterized protein (TIGR03435 family)